MTKENQEITKEIYKKILRAYNLSIKKRKLSNEVGDFLYKIHPELEDKLRFGNSFLDEMMDYGDRYCTKEQIELQIKNVLKETKK